MDGGTRGPEGREGQVGREGSSGREGLPGTTGAAGKPGPRGEVGKSGQALPWKVRMAFVAQTAISVILISVLAFFIGQNQTLAKEGAEAHDALCVIRLQLERRVKFTQEYLRQNQDPVIFGIPRERFVQRLEEDKATVRSLETLDCTPAPSMPRQEASFYVP